MNLKSTVFSDQIDTASYGLALNLKIYNVKINPSVYFFSIFFSKKTFLNVLSLSDFCRTGAKYCLTHSNFNAIVYYLDLAGKNA